MKLDIKVELYLKDDGEPLDVLRSLRDYLHNFKDRDLLFLNMIPEDVFDKDGKSIIIRQA